MRTAHRTLTRAGATQAGPLHQFEFVESAGPHAFEVFDLDTRARTHGAGRRARRQWELLGSRSDHSDRKAERHACQQISWGEPEADDEGATCRSGLAAIGVNRDHGSDGTMFVAFDSNDLPGHGNAWNIGGQVSDRDCIEQRHT